MMREGTSDDLATSIDAPPIVHDNKRDIIELKRTVKDRESQITFCKIVSVCCPYCLITQVQ